MTAMDVEPAGAPTVSWSLRLAGARVLSWKLPLPATAGTNAAEASRVSRRRRGGKGLPQEPTLQIFEEEQKPQSGGGRFAKRAAAITGTGTELSKDADAATLQHVYSCTSTPAWLARCKKLNREILQTSDGHRHQNADQRELRN